MVPRAEVRSYYDKPILKAPVWRWPIPTYLFTGGVAGVSGLLALGGRVTGNRRLARQSRLVALGALGVSTALLVEDLGRPARFYNMLRVVKPTSPMNVGTWLLTGFGGAVATGVASDLLGILPRLGAAADAGAGLLGPAVATYTAVLIADTATPGWHESRQELPFIFAGGAAAAAAGLAIALAPPAVARPARRVLVGGALGDLVATEARRRRVGPELARAYDEGRAGTLGRWSKGLTAAGALAVALGGRRRPIAIAGGLAAAAGAALQRFSTFEAGVASTQDPRFVVGPQRARLGPGNSSPAT